MESAYENEFVISDVHEQTTFNESTLKTNENLHNEPRYAKVFVEPSSQQEDEIVLTRYLYSKEEVKQSILVSMLNHNDDETLFWVYELYYSGFEKDTFMFMMTLYIEYYVYENPQIIVFIQTLYNYWLQNPHIYWIIGTIARTLSSRQHQIDRFVHILYNSTFNPDNVLPTYKLTKMNIYLKPADVEKYTTQKPEREQARHFLAKVCRFQIHKEVAYIFGTTTSNYKDAYYYHWEYYAYRSPIWKERIDAYGGVPNHEKRRIEFKDDDLQEEFYELYGFEPDEQLVSVCQKSIGNPTDITHATQIEFGNNAVDLSGNIIKQSIRIVIQPE